MKNDTDCSVIGNDIKIVLEQGDGAFSSQQGSALQNPEMNRVQLLAMLRRAARAAAPRRKQQWAAFLANYRKQEPANTNR